MEGLIENNSLRIVNVHSASKMDYQVRLFNSLAISTLVLLDMDDSGIDAYNHLISSKTKSQNEVLCIKSAGMKRCELEDIVDISAYAQVIENEFNINLNNQTFNKRNRPWSDRLRIAASRSPGIFDNSVEARIKERLADIVTEKGMSAIAERDREYVEGLIKSIARFAGIAE